MPHFFVFDGHQMKEEFDPTLKQALPMAVNYIFKTICDIA